MQFFVRIICILLLSSTAFAQIDTLSEADQIKAAVRLKIWQETIQARLLTRADIAIGYIDIDNEDIQDTMRNEMGFREEELERWIYAKNVGLANSFNEDLEPIGVQLETLQNLDEVDKFLAEANRLIYERTEKVQAEILEEMGHERLSKLRKLGLQLNPFLAEGGLVDFKAYEFLDLTEEQRKQLETIRDEHIRGLDEYIKEKADLYEEYAALEIEWGKKGEEEIKNNEVFIQTEVKKLEEKGKKIGEKFQGVLNSVKVKISLLLTDEQTKRLEKIIAETPEWLKALNKTGAEPEDDSWKDSWKPGDPVPEGKSRPKERKAFPLKIM